MSQDKLTIGVFDSGFGGLTVLRELLPLIPGAHYIYLGDTARLPYGSKSHETIARYAVSSARYLHDQGADLLVIACNTATALAFEDIRRAMPIPVIGVIQPGAEAALAAATACVKDQAAINNKTATHQAVTSEAVISEAAVSKAVISEAATHQAVISEAVISEAAVNKAVILSEAKNPRILSGEPQDPPQDHVLVLATQATIQSHAYAQALNTLGLEATEKACPLLVPLVEEGWTDHPVTDEVLKIYLTEALAAAPNAGTLLLGCTHYPLIEPAIARVLAKIGHPLTIIDSAQATARTTAQAVAAHFPSLKSTQTSPTCAFYATDSIEKFQRLGSSFLGRPLEKVNLLDLGG